MRERGAPPADIQAAVTVLGRLPTRLEVKRADLSGAYLRGANLHEAKLWDADLSGAILVGAILTKAILTKANLTGAILRRADLTGAILVDADLTAAKLDSQQQINLADGSDATTLPPGICRPERWHGGAHPVIVDRTGLSLSCRSVHQDVSM